MADPDQTPRRGRGNPDQESRTGKGRYDRTLKGAERDGYAAELRAQGLTYREIGEHLGIDNSNALRAVQRAIRAACAEPGRQLIELEVARLEMITDAALAVLQRDHVTVSHGKIIRDDDGNPLLDDGPKLAAIDRYVRARESFRKLLGLDAAIKVDAQVTEVTQQDLELQEMLRDAKAKMHAEEQEILGNGGADG